MCGLVGFVDKNKNKKEIIKKMSDKIAHRGPDSDGFFVDKNIALGFRRLSIIDLKSGDQPIYTEDGNMVIVFNGEIYNYKEIRNDLIRLGYNFKTTSDTEVVLIGYQEYGVKILDKLRGMFAFTIYNIEKEEVFVARDHFGIKPMYYATMNDCFMWGSEIKSFLEHDLFEKELNLKMLNHYLTFQYSPGSETFFKNVYKLLPGHYFIYKDGELKVNRYFEIEFKPDNSKDLEYFEKRIEEELEDSIEAHKISDVEVGSFLSSGVDSSYIATRSKVDKTFTVGYEEKKYSEIPYAEDLSKKIGVENISKTISKEEFFENFAKIQYHMDEPLADPSAVALYFVAKEASKHVKVALSGEGADEIFGGYKMYQEPLFFPLYNKLPHPVKKNIGKLAKKLPAVRGLNMLVRRGQTLEERYVGNAYIFDAEEKRNVLSEDLRDYNYQDLTKPYYEKVKNMDDVVKMQYMDYHFWLVGDILLKADKMSMANSLEVRVPFLDKKVVEMGTTIPTKYKVNKKTTKIAFRKVANRLLDDVVANKDKLGFPVPLREWLKNKEQYDIIKKEFVSANKFFNVSYILKLLNDHFEEKVDNSRKIWTIYSFLVWYKQYF